MIPIPVLLPASVEEPRRMPELALECLLLEPQVLLQQAPQRRGLQPLAH